MFLFQKMYFSATFCYLLQLLPLIPLIPSIHRWFDLSQGIHWLLDPAVFLVPWPWPISYFACSSFCLSLVSSPPSPPPPPHWATASFTQPLSRVLQVHILSNRQTFHSLFKDPFCHLPHSLLCCTQSLRQYWPRLLSFSHHARLLLSLSCSAMDRT